MKTLRLIVSVIATLTSIVANAKGARDSDYIRNDKTGDWRLKPTIETATKTLYVYI